MDNDKDIGDPMHRLISLVVATWSCSANRKCNIYDDVLIYFRFICIVLFLSYIVTFPLMTS